MSFAAACPGRIPPTPLMREGNPKHAKLNPVGMEIDETPLEGAEAKLFRGIAARLNYLGPDRPDIQYAVKEAARTMASPRACDWCLLKKNVKISCIQAQVANKVWMAEETYVHGRLHGQRLGGMPEVTKIHVGIDIDDRASLYQELEQATKGHRTVQRRSGDVWHGQL